MLSIKIKVELLQDKASKKRLGKDWKQKKPEMAPSKKKKSGLRPETWMCLQAACVVLPGEVAFHIVYLPILVSPIPGIQHGR
jgi:hypothetical protein